MSNGFCLYLTRFRMKLKRDSNTNFAYFKPKSISIKGLVIYLFVFEHNSPNDNQTEGR